MADRAMREFRDGERSSGRAMVRKEHFGRV